MSPIDLGSMLVLGLLGTGHCIGMCGPLVIAFPARCGGIAAHICYHLGRITTYISIGVVLAALGAGIRNMAPSPNYLVWVSGMQVAFSLLAATFLLLFGLMQLNVLPQPAWMSLATPTRIPGFSNVLRAARNGRSRSGMYWVGLMLGLLPCGLSYAAFVRVLPVASPMHAGLLMLAFGLGTVPGLLFIGTAASKLTRRYRVYSEFLAGLLMIGMSLSLFADVLQTLQGQP